MNSIKLFAVAIATTLLASCSGGSSNNEAEAPAEIAIKAAQTEIKGDLKGCYELVDKNYKIKVNEQYGDDLLTIELRRTTQQLPYDRKNVVIFPEAKESSAEYCAGFGVEILDANGDIIAKKEAKSTPYSWDEMTAALQLLPDETTTISVYFDDLSSAASFRITSIILPNDERKSAVDEIVDAAKQATEISDDLEVDIEDATKALDAVGDVLDAEVKMLDALNDMY